MSEVHTRLHTRLEVSSISPKERPRVGPQGGHTPEKTRAAEHEIGLLYKAQRGIKYGSCTDPVTVEVSFHDGIGNKKKSTYDVGNVYKLIEDALNRIAYKDDKQVFAHFCQDVDRAQRLIRDDYWLNRDGKCWIDIIVKYWM